MLKSLAKKNETDLLVAKNLLSHKEIANLTNTSRQTVSNTLSIMRKKGIINYDIDSISVNRHGQILK